MVEIAVSALEDVKAKDIAVLETQDKTSLFARMIIASGDSSRQVHVMLSAVRDFYDIDTLWGGEKPTLHAGAAKPWHAADN